MLARVSRTMRQLVVSESPSARAFVHHQRGYRLWCELDPALPSILRHTYMPPPFVREYLYGRPFLNYLAARGRLRVELDLQGLFAHAYAVGISSFDVPSQCDAHRLRLSMRLLGVHLNAYATESDAEASKNVWAETALLATEYLAASRHPPPPLPPALGCALA